MKVLIEKTTNQVIAASESIEQVRGGYKVGEYTYLDNGDFEVVDVEIIPNDMTPRKYVFSENGFVNNPNYIEVIPIEEKLKMLGEKNEELQQIIQIMQQALDDLILGGM